jgi:hypothetical protein
MRFFGGWRIATDISALNFRAVMPGLVPGISLRDAVLRKSGLQSNSGLPEFDNLKFPSRVNPTWAQARQWREAEIAGSRHHHRARNFPPELR